MSKYCQYECTTQRTGDYEKESVCGDQTIQLQCTRLLIHKPRWANYLLPGTPFFEQLVFLKKRSDLLGNAFASMQNFISISVRIFRYLVPLLIRDIMSIFLHIHQFHIPIGQCVFLVYQNMVNSLQVYHSAAPYFPQGGALTASPLLLNIRSKPSQKLNEEPTTYQRQFCPSQHLWRVVLTRKYHSATAWSEPLLQVLWVFSLQSFVSIKANSSFNFYSFQLLPVVEVPFLPQARSQCSFLV